MKIPTPGVDRVIKNRQVFQEDYLPDLIRVRDQQIQEITRYLAPVLQKQRPTHLWLYGPVGAGKSSTARYVLDALRREHSVRGVYVNCWEQSSLYFVLSKILDDLRVLHTDVRDTAFKRERLIRHLKDEPLIVILDEVDKPAPQERNAILYNLGSISKVGLICICNSRYFFHLAEDRVKSRIAPAQIKFPTYTADELKTILKSRKEEGLLDGTIDLSLLDRIAEMSLGDARVAIQTLLRAAHIAEQERNAKIRPHHVLKARTRALDKRKSYVLKDLTEDHRMIYQIVSDRRQVLTGALFAEYRKECAAVNRKSIAIRTFSNYVNALVSARLITSERARVPGKVRLLKVA